MGNKYERQYCEVCAWRENCAKKFSISDGGARCLDFTRDLSLKPDGIQHDQKEWAKG